MTKRTISLGARVVTAASLVLGPQTAYCSDTIWDLLRTNDPAKKRAAAPPPDTTPTAPPPANAPAPAPAGPSSIWDLMRSNDPANKHAAAMASPQPVFDPRTGKPMQAAHPRVKRGGIFGFFDNLGNASRRLSKQLHTEIKATGQKQMGLHMEKVSGSDQSYHDSNYFGRRGVGGTYDNTDLTVQGKVLGIFNFETRYSNNAYGNPYDNRVSLNYATRRFKIDAGDITGSIVGNSLLDFNRTLKGIQLSGDVTRGLHMTTLLSQTKAQTRTITIRGNNTSGPYAVYAGQIVDGSEHVRVNNHEMTKGAPPDGDYTLDPYTGILQFKPGLIIADTDVIAISYEAYGYGQQPGSIMGWRADLNTLKGSKMGFTYLMQSSGKQNANGTKTDLFKGYGANLATPYTLTYTVQVTPVKDDKGNVVDVKPTFPMTATVDGAPQVYGTDFKLDPNLPNRVFFSHPVAETQTVKITYTPSTDYNSPGGNRNVFGIDNFFSLGKMGNVVAEFGSSKLGLSGGGVGGDAWQVRGDMKFAKDKLHWNWNLRSISPSFTSIESAGFNRNERGLTMGLNYDASRTLKLTASMERAKRPSYSYNSYGSSSSYADAAGQDGYSSMNLGVAWQIGKAGTLNLLHNSMNNIMFTGGKSGLTSDTINFGYTHKSLSMDMSLSRNMNTSQYSSQTGTAASTTLTDTSNNSLTSRMNLRWRASDALSMSAVFSNSAMVYSGGQKNNAQDMSFTTEIVPMKNMRLALGYQLQNSGNYSPFTAGATNGTSNSSSGSGSSTPPVTPTRQASGSTFPTIGGGYYPGNAYNNGYNTGSVYGGGYNANLGGYGNYSGGFNNGGYGGSSFGSYGGNSRAFTVAWNYQPSTTLSFDVNWNRSSSQGDLLYNSRRNDIAFTFTYNRGERFSLNSSFAVQRMAYLGSTGGGSTSNLMFFNLNSKPFGRLTANLSYQVMKTNSALNLNNVLPGSTGTPTGSTPGFSGTGSTNINSYGMHLAYPVWRGNSLFFNFDNSASSGYFASDQRTMTVGLAFDLTNNLVFSLGWRNQEQISKDSTNAGSNYSYRARSIDADLNFNFR